MRQPGANRPPDAADDELRIRPGKTARINVLSNDSDPDGDVLAVHPENGQTRDGTVEVAADGTFTYTPRPGFSGGDRASYLVAGDNKFTIRPDPLQGNVLGNDSEPDGDPLVTGTGTITTAAGGQVTFSGDGLFSYRTPAGFVGVDRFQYGLVDSYGSWDVGEVTIGVGVPGSHT